MNEAETPARARMLAAITAGLALLALVTPLVGAESPGARVGWLLVCRGGDRDAARPPARDGSGAPAGRSQRADQPAHCFSADQRVIRDPSRAASARRASSLPSTSCATRSRRSDRKSPGSGGWRQRRRWATQSVLLLVLPLPGGAMDVGMGGGAWRARPASPASPGTSP